MAGQVQRPQGPVHEAVRPLAGLRPSERDSSAPFKNFFQLDKQLKIFIVLRLILP